MPTPSLSTMHLQMPDDFDYASYEAVHSRIGPLHESHQPQWIEYVDAWIGVAYRFYACAEHDEAFTQSIQTHGDAPQQPERYYQERDLFGFFVNGLSAIETTCYGLFAIASMLNDVYFPIKKAKNKKAINPESTARRFRTTFPKETISRTLSKIVGSQEYEDWKEVRNILAHRGSPGRHISGSVGSTYGDAHGDALWQIGIPLNASTTPSRRAWLAGTIQTLLQDADSFTRTKKF
jgi:hypothetical protein